MAYRVGKSTRKMVDRQKFNIFNSKKYGLIG